MPDVKINSSDLEKLESDLNTVLDAFGDDEGAAGRLGDAVGDSHLADRARSFASDWRKHRLDLRDDLEWLRDSIANIRTKMAETDTTLAQGLTNSGGGGSTTKSSGGGGGTGAKKAV